ncbi:MAG: polysaccharide deacetylase family protein [Patescibacteria group bacterium]
MYIFPSIDLSKIHVPEKPVQPSVLSTGSIDAPKSTVCLKRANISVFMYHYVRDHIPQDAKVIVQLSVPPKVFDEQMQHVRELADAGKMALLSTDELVTATKTHCYPHAEIFTFIADDGWIDSYTALAPIAHKYRIPFSFGIITSKLGVDNFVTENEVRELLKDPLFTIISHSVNHSDQDIMTEKQERHEICDSKTGLEALTGRTINTFIFPSGRMSANSTKLLKECGYSLGFSTGFGKSWQESTSLLDLNRIRVYPESKPKYFDKYLVPQEEAKTHTGSKHK